VTPEQVDIAYLRLAEIAVELSPDPRLLGSSYITEKIKEVQDAISDANEIATEVSRAYLNANSQVALLELKKRTYTRAMLVSPEIRNLEISFQEKMIRAEMLVDAYRLQEEQTKATAEGRAPVLTIVPLEEEIVLAKNELESLKILKDVVVEKRNDLRRIDSAIRLQNASIEAEYSTLGGRPQRSSPTPTQSSGNPRDSSKDGHRLTSNDTVPHDSTFTELLPAGETTEKKS
jgi:hypothetical protein